MNWLSAISHRSFAKGIGDWSLIIGDSATPPVIGHWLFAGGAGATDF
jgi:hypothetical protein